MTHGPPPAAGPRFSPTRGFPVGRIVGVRILITPSWVASIAVIAALGLPVVQRLVPGTSTPVAVLVALTLGVLLGASVLAHELGHCLIARRLGLDVIAVRLYLLGGVSELTGGPVTPRDEALIAAAGPAVSGLLAGASWLALLPAAPGTLWWLVLLLLALSNLVIAVFNLLPALPLDGGRVVRAGIWGLSGSRRAGTIAAAAGGYLLAGGLAGWAVYLLVRDGAAGLLPAGIALAMALFVVIGVAGEGADERTDAPGRWPADVALGSVARPVVRLPDDTSVGDALAAGGDALAAGGGALAAGGGAAVLLVRADGVARGVLDRPAALDLAGRDPSAPAALVARPILPQAIVLVTDDPDDVLDRARGALVDTFVVVDDAGIPTGVIAAADLLAAAHRRPGRMQG